MVCDWIYFQGTFPLLCKSAPLNTVDFSPALTPLLFQVWNEFLFWHLDWQPNKWEIIYCEQCSRLLLAEMQPVSKGCVSVCVRMAVASKPASALKTIYTMSSLYMWHEWHLERHIKTNLLSRLYVKLTLAEQQPLWPQLMTTVIWNV